MPQPKWTKMDDEILRRYYASGGALDIRRRLPGRTWEVIRRRANALGLKRETVFDPINGGRRLGT